MALNTAHKVTLTEAQISVILCSLEKSVKYADSDYIAEVDTIFEELEGTIDKYYEKVEKAKSKQPDMEWQIMNQLELTNEQLDLLKFIVQDFEYNDDKERDLINQIEAKIYDLQEKELLRTMNILKAQAKRPTEEW